MRIQDNTRQRIIDIVLEMMANTEPSQISIRDISRATGVQISAIYHHFESKEMVLEAAFLTAQKQIREAMMELPPVHNPSKLLRQRIVYHLSNGDLIIPMLRYFMAFKNERPDKPGGFIPPQAYMHIKQAIEFGIYKGVFASKDPDADAKVIVHSINGFLMEYYPAPPHRQKKVVDSMQSFIERALRPKERL